MNDTARYSYYAFISYSHKDAKWAEWIQRAIEHYKLPAIIRKEAQKPLPKRIAPVFRDATDLGVDVLVDGLHAELENSRYLIVVCSPNSAKPNAEGKNFVDEEVRHFCELGRVKQIIPVIVEGTPEEAFGPVLKSQEILAIDATKHPRARVLNDIVAKILGLKPDALWRRAERERRKRLVFRSVLCGLAGLCAAFAGWFAWDSNRLVKNYYANYVDSFGLPEGIFPLKESDLAHRHVHYRFEYKGFQRGKSPHADSADWCIWNMLGFRRRLVRVVQANSCGYPCKWDHEEYSDRPQILDFTYDRDLRLREIRCGRYNGEGKEPHLEKRVELWDEGGVVNGLVKFFANEGQLGFAYGAAQTTIDPAGGTLSGKSEITQHLVRRDAKGRVTQRLFLNLSGGNVPDSDGLYGFSYEYDGFGRQTAQWYLFRDGDGFSRRANKRGVAGRRYEYAGRNMRKIEYVDPEGRPTIGPYGWMVCVDSFDEFDNNTESWCFDENENKSIFAYGFAGAKIEYDASGNKVCVVCLNADGKPTLHKNGYAELRREYDACGNVTRELYFGVAGKPTLHKDGYAEVRMEYDERGNRTRESYFGVDGRPTLHKDGFSEVIEEYDERGNVTKLSYFGVDGSPALHRDGFSEVIEEYDERGNVTKLSSFGVDGKPTLHKDGFAEMRCKYDERGNVTKQSYFGVAGKPTLLKDGFAEMRLEYDERGNRTRESCFGVDGKPTLAREGYAECRIEFDERGNSTKESYFGVDGNPICSYQGFAEMRLEHDGRGNRTKELYFGVDGKPTCSYRGVAEMRVEFDERGNRTRDLYFGIDGKPTLCNEGYAEYRWEYDERGNETREASFDVDGRPAMTAKGYAEVRVDHDAYGNVTRLLCIGVDGKPVLSKDGYAERRQSYDGHGNMTRIVFLGVDGKPIMHKRGGSEVRTEYDERGNMTKISFFGVDGNPVILSKDGFAGRRQWYDAQGNKTRVVFFGVDGNPTLTTGCFAEYRNEYDARGNKTRESYFGVDGKPTLHKDGYAEVRYTYKQDGTVATEDLFDVSGNKITLRQVVVSAEVSPNLAAEKAGVKEGDVWCRLGTYDILKSGNVCEVAAAIQAVRNADKELVVARKTGDAYEIHSFKFPLGMMGIRIDVQKIPDFDKLEQAYRAYCEKKKGTKQ